MPQCKAKSKRSGVRCKKDAVVGKKVCHIHGGKSLAGIESPTFKHGRRSKYIPDRYIGSYNASLADVNQLTLGREIAAIDARQGELWQLLEENPLTPAHFKKIKSAWEALNKAIENQDRPMQIQVYKEMNELLDTSLASFGIWEDFYKVLEKRRQLVESERRRIMDAQAYIPAEQAMVLMGAVIAIIKDHITDEKALFRIAESMRMLTVSRGLE